MLFPVKGVPLPSLYHAVSRRPALVWDRFCMLIWKWKDELPRRRRAFYAKYFKGRGSFISLAMLPYFLAVEESAAAVEDFDDFYKQGRITHDARAIWQALAANGPMATLELRHAINMETKAGNTAFQAGHARIAAEIISGAFRRGTGNQRVGLGAVRAHRAGIPETSCRCTGNCACHCARHDRIQVCCPVFRCHAVAARADVWMV